MRKTDTSWGALAPVGTKRPLGNMRKADRSFHPLKTLRLAYHVDMNDLDRTRGSDE
jgi:hypothetical protein